MRWQKRLNSIFNLGRRLRSQPVKDVGRELVIAIYLSPGWAWFHLREWKNIIVEREIRGNTLEMSVTRNWRTSRAICLLTLRKAIGSWKFCFLLFKSSWMLVYAKKIFLFQSRTNLSNIHFLPTGYAAFMKYRERNFRLTVVTESKMETPSCQQRYVCTRCTSNSRIGSKWYEGEVR